MNLSRLAVDDRPLPVSLNRNAPPPGAGTRVEPVPNLMLWCSQPGGAACLSAQQEIGQLPVPSGAIPISHLQQARDLDDDCLDPDLAPLMQRITAAVGVSVGGWTNQNGQIGDVSMVSNLYAGSGCTNAARPADPPVKVQVTELEGVPHFLVRVWEELSSPP